MAGGGVRFLRHPITAAIVANLLTLALVWLSKQFWEWVGRVDGYIYVAVGGITLALLTHRALVHAPLAKRDETRPIARRATTILVIGLAACVAWIGVTRYDMIAMEDQLIDLSRRTIGLKEDRKRLLGTAAELASSLIAERTKLKRPSAVISGVQVDCYIKGDDLRLVTTRSCVATPDTSVTYSVFLGTDRKDALDQERIGFRAQCKSGAAGVCEPVAHLGDAGEGRSGIVAVRCPMPCPGDPVDLVMNVDGRGGFSQNPDGVVLDVMNLTGGDPAVPVAVTIYSDLPATITVYRWSENRFEEAGMVSREWESRPPEEKWGDGYKSRQTLKLANEFKDAPFFLEVYRPRKPAQESAK